MSAECPAPTGADVNISNDFAAGIVHPAIKRHTGLRLYRRLSGRQYADAHQPRPVRTHRSAALGNATIDHHFVLMRVRSASSTNSLVFMVMLQQPQ